MATILMPVPSADFDPTETGVPWTILDARGHTVAIATPDGRPGAADPVILTGQGLGLLAPFLMADANGRAAYGALAQSRAFRTPLRYEEIRADDFDALLLPGGHAKGMRPYLESPKLQTVTAAFFAAGKPVGAICHGVLLAARSKTASGRSVLHGDGARPAFAAIRSFSPGASPAHGSAAITAPIPNRWKRRFALASPFLTISSAAPSPSRGTSRPISRPALPSATATTSRRAGRATRTALDMNSRRW